MNSELGTYDCMSKIISPTNLGAWKNGRELFIKIYKHVGTFPQYEQYGLSDQLRRTGVSVTSNIAEGFGRRTPNDNAYRYSLAQSSLYEIQNQLLIAKDVGYLAPDHIVRLADLTVVVSHLIGGHIRSVNPNNTSKFPVPSSSPQ